MGINADFFTKIRNAYLQRASEQPSRFHVINSNQALEAVQANVRDIVFSL